jgi:hypothetical protein
MKISFQLPARERATVKFSVVVCDSELRGIRVVNKWNDLFV